MRGLERRENKLVIEVEGRGEEAGRRKKGVAAEGG